MEPFVLLAACGLALVHILAGGLQLAEGVWRSRWLSFFGGVAIGYVFLHLLPQLSQGQEVLLDDPFGPLAHLENHVYLISLAGFVIFYGLERLAQRWGERWSQSDRAREAGTFWLHIGSFAMYNVIVGYLLMDRLGRGVGSLMIFAAAMGLHFIGNDYGLRRHHPDSYHRSGRWVLAAAVVAGGTLGQLHRLDAPSLALLFAFLAGGIVLNVIKEELPNDRNSRFWPFLVGATGFSALLVLM